MQLRHHATFMQPFQCDLQTQTQETHRTTYTGTSSVTKHIEGTKRPQPHPPHRRGTFSSSAAATLHGKTQGFVLRLPPQSQPHATFMQPLQCASQHHLANQHLSTHIATEHDNNHATSCSHSNAICHHSFKKRIELRTQEQPSHLFGIVINPPFIGNSIPMLFEFPWDG